MGAGVCGAIDASSLSPQLQILAAQVGPSPPPTAVILAADTQLSLPSHDYWQVVLIIQLVVQIKLAPFIEAKLDVVSGGGDVAQFLILNSAPCRWKRF